MYREADLIDVWFDSGAMPYAQWHYPFENKEVIDEGDGFPQTISPKEWIKREDGFIPFTPLQPSFLVKRPIKMWFPMVWS